VGFIIYFKEDKKLMFYFGTVDRDWRPQGIGSQLIKAAIAEFNDVALCEASPLQCDTVACRFFESLGFVRKGTYSVEFINHWGISGDKWAFVYELPL
jgi:GNAT superfamily N-acetyltransferase